MSDNYINHIVLLLDGSASMKHLEKEVVRVADAQIAHLAQRSKELDQETRVSVYTFESPTNIQCLFYDKDVLRLPSIAGRYTASGPSTPLIDATIKVLTDLEKTAQLYGEHAFLTYVLTDGEENSSHARAIDLSGRLERLPDNWTVAVFVPNAKGIHEAKKFGFTKDNISTWDTTSAKGVVEMGETIRRATDTYMRARAQGVRGSRNLFSMDLSKLSVASVQKNLTALHAGQYRMLEVRHEGRIDEFIEGQLGRAYRMGEAYYELMVPVKVQPQKAIALYDPKTYKVYTGQNARTLLGLPDYEVRVAPNQHPQFKVFIQSTSNNRKLLPGQRVLVLS